MLMPMITATLPVYRRKYTALRHEAEYLRDAAGESAAGIQNDLMASFHETAARYTDASRRSNLYRSQAALAETAITLLTRSFSTSGSGLDEILRMQQVRLGYLFSEIEACVDQNLAIATLESILSSNE